MPTLDYEKQYGRETGKIICGVDEVGRGPLAGPVIAAAVILPAEIPDIILSNVRDSKKMTHRQREELFDPLTRHCRYAIAESSVREIDELNILWASMLAMQRAIEGLHTQIDAALIDGNKKPKLECACVTIVGGDDKSLSIACASIIAKVTRDRLMRKLAEEHPGYGWERNAGYGTKEHLEALRRLGTTDWHRDSFAPVAQLLRQA